MKYMAELRLKPDSRNRALEEFEQRGPNRNLGVSLLGAWVGKDTDVVYALLESTDAALAEQAASSWRAVAQYTITPVIDIQQI
jgi:hypothetical protein